MATITMKQMLESGIHFGHQTRRWNPKMGRYIFGERHGIYIIDLQKTLRQMQTAYITVRDTVAKGGTVLFVGTKKQARDPVRIHAERCGMYYINNRWLGGTLTNWATIQNSIKSLLKLEEMETTGKIEQFTKKEGIELRKKRDKLDRNLAGIKKMEGLPDVLFVIDTHREGIAVREAGRLNIPCIGICDTNSDPDVVAIPIPGNDDAIRAIELYCSIMADAALEGRMQYEKHLEDEQAKQGEADEEASANKLAKQRARGGDEESEGTEESAQAETPAEAETPKEAEPAAEDAAEAESEAVSAEAPGTED